MLVTVLASCYMTSCSLVIYYQRIGRTSPRAPILVRHPLSVRSNIIFDFLVEV